jgi:hypothetical protein
MLEQSSNVLFVAKLKCPLLKIKIRGKHGYKNRVDYYEPTRSIEIAGNRKFKEW